MVEVAGTKVAWTLPILWNERQLRMATELFIKYRETRLQVDKQTKQRKSYTGISFMNSSGLILFRNQRYIIHSTTLRGCTSEEPDEGKSSSPVL